jgi:hypothetical protein
MILVRLGNPAPIETKRDPKTEAITKADLEGPQVTIVRSAAPDSLTALKEIVDLWAYHGTEAPSWVSSDSETLELLLAEHFGCKRGEPKKARK